MQQIRLPGRAVPGSYQPWRKINKNQFVPVSATISCLGCFRYGFHTECTSLVLLTHSQTPN
jgi:hypothetical protein